jgi:16S rRNA (uracil1498-N3)-methyltransferase
MMIACKKKENSGFMTDRSNLIRLYVAADQLAKNQVIQLNPNQTHYLHNVMRLHEGSTLKVFNGHDGEWEASVVALQKNSGALKVVEQLKPQLTLPELHLYFPPLKQDSLKFLLEKATELGVTSFHPLLTDHTVVRGFNADKARLTLIEAAEQCERLDIPKIADLKNLKAILSSLLSAKDFVLCVCAERRQVTTLTQTLENHPQDSPYALLIGPEGGFSEGEFDYLAQLSFVKFVTLGPLVLRAETAGLAALAQVIGYKGYSKSVLDR